MDDFNSIATFGLDLSDGLDQIPASEKWDLVVRKPRHFLSGPGIETAIRSRFLATAHQVLI
jgi:hypothetical protein